MSEEKEYCYKELFDRAKKLIFVSVPEELAKLELELDKNYMVELNRSNINLVKQKIKESKAEKKYIEKYKNRDFYKDRTAIKEIIDWISVENSTRTSNKTKECMTDFIVADNNHFFERLEKGDATLVDELIEFAFMKCENRPRSLASKICKFLSDWEYKNDAYTISDSVVRSILPYYLAFYHVDKTLWMVKGKEDKGKQIVETASYKKFLGMFDALLDQLKKSDNIKRDELDHLIWYSYKDDRVRSAIAISCVKILVKEYK